MLFFSSTSVYSWLKLLSQSEIILSFPRVCIDPRKHGLKAHQWVFVLNSLLHWAFTSANVTTGIFRLFLALTKVKRGFLKIYIYPAAVYSLLKSWERKKNALWCPSYCSEKSHIQFLLDWNCFVNPQSHELAYRYKAGSDCDCRWGEDRSGGCCSWSYSKKKKKTPHCNSILTSVRLGFSAGCAYSSQI